MEAENELAKKNKKHEHEHHRQTEVATSLFTAGNERSGRLARTRSKQRPPRRKTDKPLLGGAPVSSTHPARLETARARTSARGCRSWKKRGGRTKAKGRAGGGWGDTEEA